MFFLKLLTSADFQGEQRQLSERCFEDALPFILQNVNMNRRKIVLWSEPVVSGQISRPKTEHVNKNNLNCRSFKK